MLLLISKEQEMIKVMELVTRGINKKNINKNPYHLQKLTKMYRDLKSTLPRSRLKEKDKRKKLKKLKHGIKKKYTCLNKSLKIQSLNIN